MKRWTHELKNLRTSLVLYSRLGAYVRAESLLLVATVVTMLGATLLTLARPWPLQVIVDSVLGGQPAPRWLAAFLGEVGPRDLLVASTALMVATLLASVILSVAPQYLSQSLGQRMVTRLLS